MHVIFDLDGTLALTEHRAHFLQQQPKDWRGFYAACDQDTPNTPIIDLLKALYMQGHRIEIWTGRSMEVAIKTLDWLAKHHVPRVTIYARKEGDHRPDTVLKAEWLDAQATPPDLVFEDRDQMVQLYRSRGIVCCQVAPGDF